MRHSRLNTTERGRLAESIAAAYLQLSGFRILGRNLRVGALEVDLVADRGELLVVVEVRLRRRASRAAQDWVAPEKWRRLRRAAGQLAGRFRDRRHRRYRIDLILIAEAPLALQLRHVAGCPPARPAD